MSWGPAPGSNSLPAWPQVPPGFVHLPPGFAPPEREGGVPNGPPPPWPEGWTGAAVQSEGATPGQAAMAIATHRPPPPVKGRVGIGRQQEGTGSASGVADKEQRAANFRDGFDKDTLSYVAEDVRLSTLQRKLIRETNGTVALALAYQISEAIGYPDNRGYVKRATDVLTEAIIDVLYSKHEDAVKRESAVALGKVGWVLSDQGDFEKFYQMVWKGYDKSKVRGIQVYFLRSLVACFKMRPTGVTDNEVHRVLSDLQELLEKTEHGGVMLALVDSLQEISWWRPKLFEPSFQDVVDILVGWHIDSSQAPALRSRTSEVLLSWHSYWVIDMEFSSSLLRHFMEDLESFTADVASTGDKSDLRQICERILSLMQVFNTVLSCLKSPQTTVSFLPPESSDWCETILDSFLLTLDKLFVEDILVAGQHALLLLMERIDSLFGRHEDKISSFVDLSTGSFSRLSFGGKESTVRFVTRMLQILNQETQGGQLLKAALAKDSYLMKAALSLDDKVREAVVDLFRILLNSKSIIVLQEVYSHLTALLEESLFRLGQVKRFTKESKFKGAALGPRQLRAIFFFVLSCLRDLIAAKGSVLSMWALDPSIFQLLNRHSGVTNPALTSRCPWMHHVLVKTLHHHCHAHGNFTSSSSLISAGSGAAPSPTADYFVQILATVTCFVQQEELAGETKALVLDWLEGLLKNLKESNSVHVLNEIPGLSSVARTLCRCQLRAEKKEDAMRPLVILEVLLDSWDLQKADGDLLLTLHKSFSVSLRSIWPEVQDKCCELLRRLPPLLLDWYPGSSPSGYTRDQQRSIMQMPFKNYGPSDFRVSVESLLKGPLSSNYNQGKVMKFADSKFPSNPSAVSSHLSMLANQDLKTLWVSLGVSHYCVNNKLKTPLGKPQETLTTIEKVIRNVAQSLRQQEEEGGKRADGGRRVEVAESQNLLTFHRALEVVLSNAFDGSAITLAPPAKPIAVFFAANKKTCLEWLSRLRVAVIELAHAVGDFAYVVQNAYDVLPRLASAAKAQGQPQQEQHQPPPPAQKGAAEEQLILVVAYLASALTRLGQHEALGGLYNWCRERAGRKYRWVRCLMDIVGGSNPEKGMEQFQAVLKTDLRSLPVASQSVVGGELFLGHLSLCQYEEYEAFMEDFRSGPKNQAALPPGEEYIKVLSQFNDGVVQLAEWNEKAEDPPKTSTVGTDDLLFSTHLLMLNMAGCFQRNLKKLPSWAESERLTKAIKTVADNVQVLRRDRKSTLGRSVYISVLARISEELSRLIQKKPGDLESLLAFREGCHSSELLLTIKKWGDFFVKYRTANPQAHFQLAALNLEIARQARKEGRNQVANYHLQKSLLGGTQRNTVALPDFLRKLDFHSMPLSVDRAACLRQCSKVCHLSGEGELAVGTVCGIVNIIGTTLYSQQPASDSKLLGLSSRSLLNLAHWLQEDVALLDKVYPEAAAGHNMVSVSHVLQLEQGLTGVLDYLPVLEMASDSDMVVGRLLRLAVLQSPDLAKLWHSFAEWALELGEKVLESSEKEGITLTEQEEEEVASVLSHCSREEQDEVLNMLRKCRLGNTQNARVDSTRFEFMSNELKSCRALRGAAEASLLRLHTLWATVQKRTFYCHEIAVNAFFQFVGLSEGGREDQLVVATLRLLQLTVKHALELQECLQEGLKATPSIRWKAIIPQLFSRLNHPVQVVRSRITDLLCRISKDFPHLIIFPAVVGAGEVASFTNDFSKLLLGGGGDGGSDNGNEDGVEEENPVRGEAAPSKSEEGATLQGAYARIMETMKRADATRVEQSKRLVDELQRISLLWDELWLGTLLQYNHDVGKRIKRMEDEAKRLELNNTLSREEKRLLVLDKYNIVFRPLLYVLEKIHAMTSKEPETPHEKWFVRKYGGFIRTMMAKLHNPADPAKPREVWGLLAQLQNNLGSKLHSQTSLKFVEVSPTLFNMKKSHIPMPGIASQPNLTMEAIENHMSILLTKTKPKRIAFQGSDGKKYTYLFKGLEDLHLDERIMQFLSISNVLMKRQKKQHLKARHYSVIPLGPRSGLIQWVGGAVPMFSMFKKWQQRQQLTDKPAGTERKGIAFQKPAERFYSKVYPMLREAGIAHLDNRRLWPLPVLRRAMQELLQETPNNILSQEVLMYSADATHWFELVRGLTVSFAVMSVIGYIIGLGDRHMDNLLLDLGRGGEIIHIDYNVCFEKGRNLRIPEQVPCRLTQNIVSLFGLTGVEGLFRTSCEAALEALKKGRETLMTLLEAFVYDPLVDWTPGVDMGVAGAFYGGRQNDVGVDAQDKREMQTEITFSMFAVRVAEMKGAWTEHKMVLLRAVARLEETLSGWMDLHAGAESLNEFLSQMHHSMSVLKEAEANPNHRLYTLHSRYVEHSLMETAVKVSQSRIDAFVEENERWTHLHQRAVATVTGTQLAAWTAEVEAVSTDTCATSGLVKEFLENAGQAALLEQFEAAEGSFCIGIEKLRQNLQACLQLLNHYFGISSLYPRSYRLRHRSAVFVKWARELSESFTVAKCHEVAAAFTREFSDDAEERRLKQHHVAGVSLQMEAWAQEVGYRLQNVFGRMAREKIDGSAQASAQLGDASLELQQYLSGESAGVKQLMSDLFVGSVIMQTTRKLLTLETSAKDAVAAGGSILDLTSSDGQWFLADEIHMQVGLTAQVLDAMDFLGLVPPTGGAGTDDSPLAVAGRAVYKLQAVIKQLQHFNSSFFGIVLPEGIKAFQNEDPTVLNISSQLSDIIKDAGLSPEELVQELDVEFRYAAAGMPSSNEAAVSVARSVQERYLKLVEKTSNAAEQEGGAAQSAARDAASAGHQQKQMSSGQMLFLAFNALFNSVDAALAELRSAAAAVRVEVPEEWRAGVDVVAESESIAAEACDSSLQELLDLATFMNRLAVIQECFSLCVRSTSVFKGDPEALGQQLPTGDELARPVKLFLVEYYRRQLLGIGSSCLAAFLCHYVQLGEPHLLTNLPDASSTTKLSLEELARAFLDRKLSLPGKDRLRYLTLELENLYNIMKKVEVAKYLEQNVEALQSSLQISQLQRNSFQWFHVGLIHPPNAAPADTAAVVAPERRAFLAELAGYVAVLMAVNEEVTSGLLDRYRELHSTVESRLKWACGANPDLREVFDGFTTSFVTETGSLKNLSGILKSVSSAVNSVLHHEALRTSQTQESIAADSAFMALLGDCQQSAALKETHSIGALTDQELNLFTISPPGGDVIDSHWIRQTEEAISTRVRTAREQLRTEHGRCHAVVPLLQAQGKELIQAVTQHQKLMADVGALLKTISKSEDYDIPGVATYLQTYKNFSDLVSRLISCSRQDEQDDSSVKQMLALVDHVKELVPSIYNGILDFTHTFKEENLESFKVKPQPSQRPQRPQQEDEESVRRGRQAMTEEKNAFALNVLRRVRFKLEGREPDALKRTGVQEQVDFIIREATGLDNLALMYEGWTAWI